MQFKRFLFPILALSLAALACGLPGSAQPALPREVTVVVVVTPTPLSEGEVSASPTPAAALPDTPTPAPIPVTSTETAASLPTQAEAGPQCSALRNVNLRKGPGLVYDPPLNVVRQGEVVVPQGFTPQGFPDGSWIFVQVAATGEQGWISADPNLVNCSLDVASLPPVNPPPTPAAARLRSSKPDGSPNGITGNIFLSPKDFLRFEAIGPGGSADGDHIQKVSFLIRDQSGGYTLYEHTENQAPYCAFGGDNGCNPWPKRDGRYVWGEGGDFVEDEATYQVDVFVTSDDETGSRDGNWNFTVTVDLP